ncbi:MAG: patatin-like phospholipase family protein [Hyphomicrobium sp.]|nr:patatin-like phospholipase family protein [Hyphomicrobium sp.]
MGGKRRIEASAFPPPGPVARTARPRIGLALGGGGARGLAHIVALEAFDDLGLKPSVIAGTSMGAILGAAYASGLSGREIRRQVEETLAVRVALVRDIFSMRSRAFTRPLKLFSPLTALLSSEALVETVYPSGVATTFEDLAIPMKVVATDFYGLGQAVFSSGPLRPAVAASMALPAVFEPVIIDGRALVDGGLVNPLPFDLIAAECDITVAIDVSATPSPSAKRVHPTATEALFGAPAIFERTILREKLKTVRPDILIEAGIGHFQLLDLWRTKEILAAAEPIRARIVASLGKVISAETVPALDTPTKRLNKPDAKP